MTRRRRKFPGWDHHALGVMGRMRDLMLSEVQLDRAVAAMKTAEEIIATGRAAGSDMSAAEARLEEERERLRGLEIVLVGQEAAAGLDPRPPRLCPAIAAHLDAIGLEDLRL